MKLGKTSGVSFTKPGDTSGNPILKKKNPKSQKSKKNQFFNFIEYIIFVLEQMSTQISDEFKNYSYFRSMKFLQMSFSKLEPFWMAYLLMPISTIRFT